MIVVCVYAQSVEEEKGLKKNKQAPLLSRWWRYKWSGLITFAPIIILSIGLYIYMDMEREFFSAWSCETINDYLMDIEVPDDLPNAHTLPEDQHLKLHKINDECFNSEKFSNNNHK